MKDTLQMLHDTPNDPVVGRRFLQSDRQTKTQPLKREAIR